MDKSKIGYKDNTGVYIKKELFPAIKSNFECKNLKKIQAQNMNMWNWQKLPDTIKHYDMGNNFVKIPMGILGKWDYKLLDNRSPTKSISIPSVLNTIPDEDIDIELREKQHVLVEQLTSNNIGLGHCSTGTGKTYMLSKVIEKFQRRTLVVCSGIELMNQMKNDLHEFFGIVPYTISGSKTKQKGSDDRIVIGNIDSLIKLSKAELSGFDLIILDEVDRFLQAENRLKWIFSLCPERMYGFTGTVKLNHVSDDVFKIYLGPKYELLQKNFTPQIYKVLTDFEFSQGELYDIKDFHELKKELYFDEGRNNLIISTIKKTLGERKGICFCEYVDHAKLIKDRLEEEGIKTFMLIGEVKSEERKVIKNELKLFKGACVLIGSVKIVGRGFNVPELSIGYLTTTEKFNSNIEQYVGRILRQSPSKKDCIWYDFLDTSPSILANQAKSRNTTYKREFPGCDPKII